MSENDSAINARRTFAIISHPDAGKTTITEKLLCDGGFTRVRVRDDGECAARIDGAVVF